MKYAIGFLFVMVMAYAVGVVCYLFNGKSKSGAPTKQSGKTPQSKAAPGRNDTGICAPIPKAAAAIER